MNPAITKQIKGANKMPIQIIKPDSEDQQVLYTQEIFLAGSIEMGAAVALSTT
jgi:hypothetical protein